ncbi:MAG: hypothetical protein QOH96_1678 [Blastocatellia bacterium]|nr:hypothetical protein [Blastocatellia bacterium]
MDWPRAIKSAKIESGNPCVRLGMDCLNQLSLSSRPIKNSYRNYFTGPIPCHFWKSKNDTVNLFRPGFNSAWPHL